MNEYPEGYETDLSDTDTAADRVNGELTVEFTFDSAILDSGIVVVYENIYRGSSDEIETTVNTGLVGQHANIDSESQTVYYPSIGTEATADGTHSTPALESLTIVDAVSYTNLEAGQLYRIEGVLMNKNTGEALVDDNGNQITATKEFVPAANDGTENIEFTFDATAFEWQDVVVFETLYKPEAAADGTDLLVAYHKDINDESQTVSILEALVADDFIQNIGVLTQTGDYLPFATTIIIVSAAGVGIGIRHRMKKAS